MGDHVVLVTPSPLHPSTPSPLHPSPTLPPVPFIGRARTPYPRFHGRIEGGNTLLQRTTQKLAKPRPWLPDIESGLTPVCPLYQDNHLRAGRRVWSVPPPGVTMKLIIRPEEPKDRGAIQEVNQLAYGRDDEAQLVEDLRGGNYARLSLVADAGGQVVAHIMFSAVQIMT